MDAVRSTVAGVKPATGDDCLLSTGRDAWTAERIYHNCASRVCNLARPQPRNTLAPYFRDLPV